VKNTDYFKTNTDYIFIFQLAAFLYSSCKKQLRMNVFKPSASYCIYFHFRSLKLAIFFGLFRFPYVLTLERTSKFLSHCKKFRLDYDFSNLQFM